MEKAVPQSLMQLSALSMRCSLSYPHSWKPSEISTNSLSLKLMRNGAALRLYCFDSNGSTSSQASTATSTNLPVLRMRKRYRKLYPGENVGITEEMRFVAMRLRNVKGKKITDNGLNSTIESEVEGEDSSSSAIDSDSDDDRVSGESSGGDEGEESWTPSLEGFVKYLVDSKLVFSTVEHIIDESSDVSYAYFRRNGLERSEALSKDLEWLSEWHVAIPDPSTPGVAYANYLKELAEKSAPSFLCHLYNIYFSHIAGGQVIARKVSEKLLEERELEFYSWDGNVQDLLKGFREKLNMLGEHWSRDEKNKCLRESSKSFRYLGQIVRLIIL